MCLLYDYNKLCTHLGWTITNFLVKCRLFMWIWMLIQLDISHCLNIRVNLYILYMTNFSMDVDPIKTLQLWQSILFGSWVFLVLDGWWSYQSVLFSEAECFGVSIYLGWNWWDNFSFGWENIRGWIPRKWTFNVNSLDHDFDFVHFNFLPAPCGSILSYCNVTCDLILTTPFCLSLCVFCFSILSACFLSKIPVLLCCCH